MLVMRYIGLVLVMASAVAAKPAAQVAPATNTVHAIQPGVYTYEGGMGTAELKDSKGLLEFDINTVNMNTNVCGLTGTLAAGKLEADVKNDVDDKICKLTFVAAKDRITISTSTPEACAEYCGHNAYFEGDYFTTPSGCDDASIKKTRLQFKKDYDKKLYDKAATELSAMRELCQNVIHRNDKPWVDNDLAVTYAKIGKKAECLKILEAYKELAAQDDADAETHYVGGKEMVRVAKAVRANLKLCQ